MEIAAHIVACTFNEDFHAILQMYEVIEIYCGPNIHRFSADSMCIATADRMNAREKNTSPSVINKYFGADYAVKNMLYGSGRLCVS